jgi:dipeptidase D
MKIIMMICCLLFLNSLASAKPIARNLANVPEPEPNSSMLKACSNDAVQKECEYEIFKDLSKVYRPTGEEKYFRTYLNKIISHANAQIWKTRKLIVETDQIGNVIVRVPATKVAFAQKPSIALQGHMDIVLAAAKAAPGEDLKPYFFNGVETEERGDGYVYSKGSQLTLGADNGAGLAMMIRYILDKKIEHPPLELVFTVNEEVGLKGAAQFDLKLASPMMINFDAVNIADARIIKYGCLGAIRKIISGPLPMSGLTPQSKLFKIEIKGLKGGHSGLEIHLKRANSARLLAQLYLGLEKQFSTLRLVEFQVGSEKLLNKIPSDGSMILSLSSSTASDAAIQAAIQQQLQVLMKMYPDDIEPKIAVSFQGVAANTALSDADSRQFSQKILEFPNGVLTEETKFPYQFPNRVQTSSNLGFVVVKEGQFVTAYMARGFINEDLQKFDQTITRFARTIATPGSEVKETYGAEPYPPWLAKDNSWLIQFAIDKTDYFLSKDVFSAGIEPVYFAQKFPNTEIIAVGVESENAHSFHERMKLSSLYELSAAVQKLIYRLGER